MKPDRSLAKEEMPKVKIEPGNEGIITSHKSVSRELQVCKLKRMFNIRETYTIDNSNMLLCGPR